MKFSLFFESLKVFWEKRKYEIYKLLFIFLKRLLGIKMPPPFYLGEHYPKITQYILNIYYTIYDNKINNNNNYPISI